MNHSQFESIHPFLDGNGRVGRLLITLFLCERGHLSHPLLYLSGFLETHRSEYYERLQKIRVEGDWIGGYQVVYRAARTTFSVSPHKFEELITELLEREGMNVHLTPKTRDGGRDILASLNTAVGEHLY